MMITIMLPVMLGFIGLAIAGGRFMMVHSQLQDLADAAALAGAKQLTGVAGSIAAARSAVNDAWAYKNGPWLSNDGTPSTASQVASVHVCADIATDPCTDTTDDTQAQYVQVTTIQRGLIPAFLAAVGATATDKANATATAESVLIACNVQPLMLCNPFENDSDPSFAAHVSPGVLFHLKVQGANNPSTPGDFGLLDPPNDTTSGATLIEQLLSQQNPKFCYINAVSPHTGSAAGKVNLGINVRFDLKPQGNGGPVLDTSPAPVVIKGSKTCNANNWSNPQNDLGDGWRMPKDATMTPGVAGNYELGSGGVDPNGANIYWLAHHGSGTWPTDSSGALLSRYVVYQGEVNGTYPFTPSSGSSTPAGYTEAAAPSCTAANSESIVSRRVISVTIVDCIAHPFNGNSSSGIQSSAYADFFVTQPSQSGDVYAEFVRMMTPNSDGGKLKQLVQLVRDR